MAVEHVNSVVEIKSEKDQAGGYTEPKWLLVAIDTLWLSGVSEVLVACLADPPQLANFADKVDLGIFDKVWLVWETIGRQEGAEPQEQATSVIVLSQDSPPIPFAINDFRTSPVSP